MAGRSTQSLAVMDATGLRYQCGTRPQVKDHVTLNGGRGPRGHVAVIIDGARCEAMPGYDAESWARQGNGLLIDAESKGLLFVANADTVHLGWKRNDS